MGPRRKTVDLAIALEDPSEARKYIAEFDWNTPEPQKYIVWGLDEKIYFDNMSDAEAVFAAKMILREIQIPQEWNQAQFEKWEH